MTKQEALIDAAWAKALFEALTRYEPTPLYEATAAYLGHRPVLTVVAS